MIREALNALLACVVTFALCAVGYPALVYAVGHTLFPRQAAGSLVERDGVVVGSSLIAQPFTSARYFAPRPSAAGPSGYSADAASGSNLGATNPALRDRIMLQTLKLYADANQDAPLQASLDRFNTVQADLAARKALKEPTTADQAAITQLDTDLALAREPFTERLAFYLNKTEGRVVTDQVTTSGSGLDPEISPEAAYFQAARVAQARQVPVDQIRSKIEARIDRSGALFGAPARVNVLLLNLDLDR